MAREGQGYPCYQRDMMMMIIKDYFYTLYVKFFLLNLVSYVSGYLSTPNKIACFPNSWGILLYRLVT